MHPQAARESSPLFSATMTSMWVHLVRHGEVENPDGLVYGDLPGFNLSETGQTQAREAAARLAASPLAAIWSSPLQRALQTAEAIAASHHLPVRVHPQLTEWRLGSWTGILWSELANRLPGQLEAYLSDPTDLAFADESLDDLARRVAIGIVEAIAISGGDVVIVGHQDPLQAARLLLTGQSLDRQHQDKPAHGSVITLSPDDPWREVEHWRPSR